MLMILSAKEVIDALGRLRRTIETGFAELGAKMSALDDSIADLKSKVDALNTVDQSAVALINGISDRISQAVTSAINQGASANELQALSDLASQLDAQTTNLAAAVAANTPASTSQPGQTGQPAQPAQPGAPDQPPATSSDQPAG